MAELLLESKPYWTLSWKLDSGSWLKLKVSFEAQSKITLNLNVWDKSQLLIRICRIFSALILFNILSNCLLNNKCKNFSLCCSFRCVKVLWNQEFMTAHRHVELEAQQTLEVSRVPQIYTFWGCALWDQCQSRLIYSGSTLVNLEESENFRVGIVSFKDWLDLPLSILSAPSCLITGGHALRISRINSISLSTFVLFLLRNQMA